jgi:class 3 adenylate cyclase/pimeloyl-ACP methyl ester carboxylesterase
VAGEGPIDLVYIPSPPYNLDIAWDYPQLERLLRRLASFSRLILVNPRGTGISDPVPAGITIEEWTTDVNWVLDALGIERVALLSTDLSGLFSLVAAATFPERTLSLALVNSFATLRRTEDYEWGLPPDSLQQLLDHVTATWGTGDSLSLLAPELADDEHFREQHARLERLSLSFATIKALAKLLNAVDLRAILPSIQAPTLIISHEGASIGGGRFLAEQIPNARYVERPGFWGIPWLHDVEWTLDELQAFFTGSRGTPSFEDRVLATVLFTDIVSSTERAGEIGDQRWRILLDEHDAVTGREIERFRGRLVKSVGDGVLATFDGPARAIRCALAVADAVRPLGIEVRTGLHSGEVELRGDDVGGIAVHIAERVMGAAGAGEVLVSSAVPPLVAGSGIEFDDRGMQTLKGVPGKWGIYSVRI